MKPMNSTEDLLLLTQAREALDRGPQPSAATLGALRAAAKRHASRGPWKRFWGDPRRRAAVLGGLAAAAVLAVVLAPHEPQPAAGHPEATLADADWLLFDVDAEESLALLSLLAAGLDAAQADALLRFQEQPGAFEGSYALSAYF